MLFGIACYCSYRDEMPEVEQSETEDKTRRRGIVRVPKQPGPSPLSRGHISEPMLVPAYVGLKKGSGTGVFVAAYPNSRRLLPHVEALLLTMMPLDL